jgi:hypothetical protein
MSSSNSTNPQSSVAVATTTSSVGVGSAVGTLLSWGIKLLKVGILPGTLGWSGLLSVSRFIAFTTAGRVLLVLCLSFGGYTYLKHHFIAAEAAKWKKEVVKKQEAIVGKVASVNTETQKAQEAASMELGWWDKVTAVVVDGIWKVQPRVVIEKETIDLINQTRDEPQSAPGS